MNQQKIQKILIRLPARLVDAIKALPLINGVCSTYADAEISVLVTSNHKNLLRNTGVDRVIVFERKPKFSPILETGEDVISFLQREEFDIGIICSKSFSSMYIFYQGMVKRRIGFTHPFGSFMLTDKVVGNNYSDLIKLLKIDIETWDPKLYAKTVKHSHLHIGISHSFKNETHVKRWYSNLVSLILEEIPYVKISIFGKKKNFDSIEDLIGDRKGSISNFCNDMETSELVDKIHNFEVFVSDNKGLLAVANAVDTPSVDISGLTENQQLLPEDFFNEIKEAILRPLKDRSAMFSFSGYLPIKEGITDLTCDSFKGKKVGVIILAGGMGRRLGMDKPKGLLRVGDKCLYDILLEKADGADKIGILTSPITFLETKNYCKGRDIDLFCKKVYPTESYDGMSPEGNGALFDAIVYSKYWDEWKDLDIISIIAVDNPLADPLDKDLLATDKQLAVIGVERDRKEERLGVLCKKGMSLAVREYFTLGKEGMAGLGYSGSFAATPEFFEEVSKKKLPFYRVEKKNQIFYERLLIDGFTYANSFDIIEKRRKDCFFPIKEKRDLFRYIKIMNMEGENR